MHDFIKQNCLTIKGGLNNRILIDSWWENRSFSKEKLEIISQTSFLPASATLTQRCWHIFNSIYSIPKCTVCHAETNFKNFSFGYYATCSQFCSTQDKTRNAKISKNQNYDHTKIKKNNLEKYGVESFFQTPEFQEKTRKTKLDRYGSEIYNNIDKAKQTNLEKYGNSCYLASKSGQEYLSTKRFIHGGSFKLDSTSAKALNDINSLIEMNKTMSVLEIAETLGVSYSGVGKKFLEHGIIPNKFPRNYNKLQGKLFDELKVLGLNIIFNDRKVIYPKELDIYFPDKKVAIELNGLYWHSFYEAESKEDKLKHEHKRMLCQEKDIRLIQITDHEYLTKPDICINIIKTALGISQRSIRASKCKIVQVDTKTEKDFLDKNHIQGYSKSSIKLGLEYENELVFLMTFGKARFDSQHDFELIRAASKLGYHVHGGASKLLKFFRLNNPKKTLISYCDKAKFTGNMYHKLGMTLIRESSPGYFYHKSGKIISRFQAQKKNLSKILSNYDENLTESENMFQHNWGRYWDCGTMVFSDFDHAHKEP